MSIFLNAFMLNSKDQCYWPLFVLFFIFVLCFNTQRQTWLCREMLVSISLRECSEYWYLIAHPHTPPHPPAPLRQARCWLESEGMRFLATAIRCADSDRWVPLRVCNLEFMRFFSPLSPSPHSSLFNSPLLKSVGKMHLMTLFSSGKSVFCNNNKTWKVEIK